MPWFPVRPQHAICLSGFPVHQAAPPKGNELFCFRCYLSQYFILATPQKRPHEVISVDDKSPDTKRVRLSQPNEKLAPATTVAPTRPPPPSQPVASNPIQPPPQNIPPQIPVPGPQQLFDRLRQEEAKMRELNKAMVEARNRGENARAEAIHQEMTKRLPQHTKLRQVVYTMLKSPQMAAMRQQQMQGQQLANQGNPGNATANLATPSLKVPQGSSPAQGSTAAFPPNDGANLPANNFVPPQGMHMRSLSNPGEVGQGFNASRMQMSPSAAAQMQKVIEQQNRTGQPPPQHLGAGPSKSSPNIMANMPPGSITSTPPMNVMTSGDHPPSNAAQPPQPQSNQQPVKTPVWQGTLRWSGVDATGKREMQVHVVAFAQNPAEW